MNRALQERLYKAFNEKNGLQRYFARKFLFNCFQRLGFHVLGDHFYEPIPNTRLIAEKYVDGPRPLRGIDFRFAECEARALKLIQSYGAEFPQVCGKFGFQENNWYFRGLDALMLYVMLRDLKPSKLVEVGQGYSTRIALSALERNAAETGRRTEFISIDPYARYTPDSLPGQVEYRSLRQELQAVDLAPVLAGCRFLFIDSSHVHKFGSDVAYEISELYPGIHPDTILHIHDIFSPYDYPRNWIVQEKRFWNEQYLVEAFLMFNEAFQVHLPVNLLARQSAALKDALKALKLYPDFEYAGYSLYLRRT